MEITEAQYGRIKDVLPVQRGNVRLNNLQVLNAVLYVAEQGCKWRGLPKRFGRWHTIYTRMNRWSKNGVLDQVFENRRPIAFPNRRKRSLVGRLESNLLVARWRIELGGVDWSLRELRCLRCRLNEHCRDWLS